MGKQISFLMDSDDEQAFIGIVLSTGKILFEGRNPKPKEIGFLPEPFSGKGWFQILLFNPEHGDLHLNKTIDGREFINDGISPVIEFTRTVVREGQKEISRGRLWVEMNYIDDEGKKQKKAPTLDAWYAMLSKWIKKNLPKTEVVFQGKRYVEYASESMIALLSKGYKVI